MMIDKRLIGTVPESRKYIAANVTLQWCGLVANVAGIGTIFLLNALLALVSVPIASRLRSHRFHKRGDFK